jgi:hypothetical protein
MYLRESSAKLFDLRQQLGTFVKILIKIIFPIEHAFYYLGTIRRFSWNGTEVSH